MILISAYGRVYHDLESALIEWQNGYDFKIYGGPYCSIRDQKKMENEFGKLELIWNMEKYSNDKTTGIVTL